MKNFTIAFILLLPLILIFNGGTLIYNFVGLMYALVLYRLARSTKGKEYINNVCNYTDFLTDKYLRK